MEKGLLGNTIRQARIDRGLSQEELAEKIGVTPTHIKHMESGHRQPSINVLYELTKVLYISLDSVFWGKQENKNVNKIKLLICDCTDEQLKLIEEMIMSIKKYT